MTSAVDSLWETGCIGEGSDACVLALLTPLTPEQEPADTLFVFSTCLPSWMSHYLTSHKYTHRCRNAEGEVCSAHIKNSYWRCQQGAQRSWVRFRGNPKEKYCTLLCLQPQVGWGFISHPSKEGFHPESIVLESIARNRWQMHECRWWILQYFGMLAEFLVSWLEFRISWAPIIIIKCQWVIVKGWKQWHKVSI